MISDNENEIEINSIKELTENFEKSQEILYISLWLKIKFC